MSDIGPVERIVYAEDAIRARAHDAEDAALRAALIQAAAAIRKRCRYHDYPVVIDPQGDAHYPLKGRYHDVTTTLQNQSNSCFGNCYLTEEELDILAAIEALEVKHESD